MTIMMTFHQIFCLVIAIFTIPFFSTSNFLVVAEAKIFGFNVDLIHRDSPKSPFYNPSLTPSQRIASALRRSVKWAMYVKSDSTNLIPDHGEFLIKISIGTPPVEMLALIDTGSDLTWIQCEPCTNCFKQKTHIFNPNNSSTYKAVPCTSNVCHSLYESSCNTTTNTCQYLVSYGGYKSFSKGGLATEALQFGPPTTHACFPNITIGCGHENVVGSLSDEGSGIVGFGGGPDSFISQVNRSIGGKFSYCLVPYKSSKFGKLYFGESGAFSSTEGLVSTPLVPNNPSTFYYVTLTGITVRDERIVIPKPPIGSGLPQDGNMFIDSGTTLTYLPLDIYNQFESTVKRNVKLSPVDDPQGILSLCYNNLKMDYFPNITFNFPASEAFKGDLRLRPVNTFVQTDDNTMCLAFTPTENDQPAILGNLAQMNLFVGYDLEKKAVSFKYTHCGRE